jgi:1-acyl-sn-glycerol-3-phosphate acyltransferase
MTLIHSILIAAFKGLTHLLCRIDDAQLAQVPNRGPLIVVTNHVNILEIPIIYTHLQPRPVTGLVSAHRWDSRWLRWLLNACGAIPLRRGKADIAALRRAMEMLKAGYIVVIAPEGTRSGHGRLQKAHPGVVLLALNSGAPMLPVAYYGSEHYRDNLRRLRRTDFHIVVGKPFYLDAGGIKVTRQVRREMINEVMYQMSALLPPAYRGVYSDLDAATEIYLAFQTDLTGVGIGQESICKSKLRGYSSDRWR